MQRKDFFTFIASFDLPCKKLHKLFTTYIGEDFSFDVVYEKEFLKIVGQDLCERIKENANEKYLNSFKDELFEKKIKLLSYEDEQYPERLINMTEAPFFLFCKGNISLLNKTGVAVIGTRMPTAYGKVVTERFAGDLARNGVVIISGLAYGIDSIAHRKALEVGGKTIAVLGGGFDKIYPSEHTDLAREIAEKGLLVSEYSPKFVASRYTFPQRNRIVAGLSNGVLITEAGAKSGTIITKDYAIDNGITIYAVPGNITSEKSACTNNIILHGQGLCVLSAEDILGDLGINMNKNQKVVQLTLEEEKIVELLSNGEKDMDFLCQNLDISAKNISSLLVNLEIRDIIKKVAGGMYTLL